MDGFLHFPDILYSKKREVGAFEQRTLMKADNFFTHFYFFSFFSTVGKRGNWQEKGIEFDRRR